MEKDPKQELILVEKWDLEELLRIAWEHPKTSIGYCEEVQNKYLPQPKEPTKKVNKNKIDR